MTFLDTGIEYLKGVGPQRAETLKAELGIFTFRDLLFHFPFRYIDKTRFHLIRDIQNEGETYQLKGILRRLETLGEGRAKRLTATLRDESGAIELVWFQGMNWLERTLEVGKEYVVFGRANEFNGKFNMPHPEMEEVNEDNIRKASNFEPVYPTTDKLTQKGLDPKGLRRLVRTLFEIMPPAAIPENLPDYLLESYRLAPRWAALKAIHFPTQQTDLDAATRRLKFEELFLLQLRLLQTKTRGKF
jgi:ATP-dependent DNA helicase RecG